MCKEPHCHCLCFQETHQSKDKARPLSPGMAPVFECLHIKHGSSGFIRDGLKVNNISVCEEVELITVDLSVVVVHSMYKPPHEQFRLPALGQRNKPHVVIGDFYSHSVFWGHTTNRDGEWVDSNSLSLIHNTKLPNHSTVQ